MKGLRRARAPISYLEVLPLGLGDEVLLGNHRPIYSTESSEEPTLVNSIYIRCAASDRKPDAITEICAKFASRRNHPFRADRPSPKKPAPNRAAARLSPSSAKTMTTYAATKPNLCREKNTFTSHPRHPINPRSIPRFIRLCSLPSQSSVLCPQSFSKEPPAISTISTRTHKKPRHFNFSPHEFVLCPQSSVLCPQSSVCPQSFPVSRLFQSVSPPVSLVVSVVSCSI